MVTYTGAIFGAITGFIATWSISTATATSELESGQQIGTFYPIISIALGLITLLIPHTLGFGLHIITAHCRSHTWSHRNKMEKLVYSILIRGR
jgi:H+/Cl- antiporter ClcA